MSIFMLQVQAFGEAYGNLPHLYVFEQQAMSRLSEKITRQSPSYRTIVHDCCSNLPSCTLPSFPVQRMYQSAAGTKKLLSTAQHAPDADFHDFLGYVETNNVYQVRSRLRDRSAQGSGANRLVSTAEERHGNTPLHRAVSLGFVEICSVLLEAGADIDAINTMGDTPIHCCWRFWKGDTHKYSSWRKNPYLMVTKQMKEDFARMVRACRRDTGFTPPPHSLSHKHCAPCFS